MGSPHLAENYISRFQPEITARVASWGRARSLDLRSGCLGALGMRPGQHPHVSCISVIFLMATALKPAHFTIELPSLGLVSLTHKYRLQPMNPLFCFYFPLSPFLGQVFIAAIKNKVDQS